MAAGEGSTAELLVSRVARAAGLDRVADRLGFPGATPYLYVGALLVCNYGVLGAVQYAARGYHPVLAFPLWFVPPVATVLAVWSTRYLARAYDDITATLEGRLVDPSPLDGPLAPRRLQAGTYLVMVAGGIAFFFFQPGVREASMALEGRVLFPVKFVVVFLGLYYLVIAEVAAVMIAVHVLLPRRLLRAGIDLDFGDRTRLGGLKPVGRLIQRSSQVYFAGLFAYTLVTFAPRVFPSQPTPAPGRFFSAVFLAAWGLGFVLFLLPTVWLHREMKRQKTERLAELQDRLIEHGTHDDPLPDRPADDEEVPRYLYFHVALDRVERTREYPTDAGLVRDVGVSSLPSILTYVAALLVALLNV